MMNFRLPMFFIAAALLGTSVAHARPFRVNQVPNGGVNRCLTCHASGGLGFPSTERNPFGQMVEDRFLSQSGNVLWGSELASLDADGDGLSNGAELLDPSGAWKSGDPNPGNREDVTAPGTPDEVKATVAPALGFVLQGLLAFGFFGISCATAGGVRSRRS